MLSTLGFCVSYDEVVRYKQSVLQFVPGYVEELLTSDNRPFMQYFADNVDHNVRTLDGRGTFHGMDVISVSAFPKGTFHIVSGRVLRTCKRLTALDVAKGKSVPVARYCPRDGQSLGVSV